MQNDQWFARTLYPSNGLAKSNDFWEDMDDYTNKYIEVLKDNEDEQVEKIHDDHTEPGVPKFVGKYTHGMQEHENELVNDTRNLRNQEKKEAKRRQGSDNPDSVLRRVDQYAKKEMAVIDRNEKKQKNRIRQDHNSKGTPSSIHDQNHEYDDHTENMKDDIGDVQRQEREDIRRKLGKSRNALTLMDVYNNASDVLSKRLVIPGNGSTHPEDIAQDELRQRGVFKINSTKEGVPVLYDTKPETSPPSDRPPTKFRTPKATSTATMIPLSEAVGKPGGSAMSADMKSRLAEIKRRATAEDAAEPRTPSRSPSTAAPDPEELTDDELGRIFQQQHKAESKIKRRKKSLSTAQLENYLSKAQSVLSTPKPRVSARDVDSEGYLSDDAGSRISSADQRRRAESGMARRSTMKPNNIREVNRRQIDRNTSRPGSKVNIAQGRKVKSDEQASGMKTKGDLPIPVPPDPYRTGEETGTQRRDVRQRADERMRGHEAAESAHEERIYRQGAARRRERIAAGIPEQDLDWDGSYHNV